MTIFARKKCLITGHTGFKGSWLALWLDKLGADVVGLSIDVPSEPSHFQAADISAQIDDHRLDVRDCEALKQLIHKIQPDFVFHLAAQALIKHSYEYPLATISTNAIGSANVLESLRTLGKPVIAVMITSDKAYDNVEWAWGYRETDRLGGKDPYSASKGMAELAIRSYVESFFNLPDTNVRIGIARALILKPKLIICDEPVSALDVSIQAQVINLLKDLQKDLKLSLIFITHDLSIAKHISDNILVLYFGKTVEMGLSRELFNNPRHSYTKKLISSVPIPEPNLR